MKQTFSNAELLDVIIKEIISSVKSGKSVDNRQINSIVAKKMRDLAQKNPNRITKMHLVPHFIKRGKDFWEIDAETEKQVLANLQIKPRRTASGVATITIMTKPWACSSACIFCPNDLRMPKSYLTDEPVCQRAQFVWFDPYLQVLSRLRALKQMGHPTDKIELIVLGGTWSDYSENYQIWFIKELFKALNDSQFLNDDDAENIVDENNPFKIINNSPAAEGRAKERQTFYENLKLPNNRELIWESVEKEQKRVNNGEKTFNDAIKSLYLQNEKWQKVSQIQTSNFDELENEQKVNETSKHRVVGLVIETRPDLISAKNLTTIRRLGCTKVQIGVQSLDQEILNCNSRRISVEQIAHAHSLLRLFGFKIHVHFMVNLFGATVENDIDDYSKLVENEEFLPDEVKLYPCVLVEGTGLTRLWKQGKWKPYSEEELVRVLVADTLKTPRYCRISRMIRDISAKDIVAGNKKSNLRQIVENEIMKTPNEVSEIRFREIGTAKVNADSLHLKQTNYSTSKTEEIFFEWIVDGEKKEEEKIAGFLRLSLPKENAFHFDRDDDKFFPQELVEPKSAMIREVHVYGKVANINSQSEGGQHRGLGKELIKQAATLAKERGFEKMKVISAVGTREYYSKLGFKTNGLWQELDLRDNEN